MAGRVELAVVPIAVVGEVDAAVDALAADRLVDAADQCCGGDQIGLADASRQCLFGAGQIPADAKQVGLLGQ